MFDAISPTYDRLNHLLSLNIDKRWRRRAARKLITSETGSVLDVCSGTGDFALAFLQQARAIGTAPSLISTDFTPSMTARAKEKLSAQSADGQQPVTAVADTMNLPFPSSKFDLVTAAFGIRNVVALEDGIREMVRVCRSGGRIGILEFSHPKNPLFRGVYNFYFFRVLPWIGRIISRTRAYLYLPKSVARFPDTDEFAGLLGRIAGGKVTACRFTFGIATLYIAEVNK